MRYRHPWPALLAIAVAVALLVAAVPRLMAGLLTDRHEVLFYELEQGRNLHEYERMWSAIAGYEAALEWSDDALLYQRLGQLYLAVAGDPLLEPSRRRLLLTRSVENQREGLARAPSDSFAWAQLALALYGTEGVTPAFQQAFRRSIETAPVAPALATTRALLGLRAWPWLEPASRELVAGQLAVAATVDARQLAGQLFSQGERRLALSLLAAHPESLSRLAAALSER